MAQSEKKSVTFFCPKCEQSQSLVKTDLGELLEFPCGACKETILLTRLNQENVDSCCLCRSKDLYQHKDFNKTLGIALFLIGAVLAPWTYYASLFVALILDAALYPLFPWMAVCYKCETEHRGWPKNPRLNRFNHEIAAHYEYSES